MLSTRYLLKLVGPVCLAVFLTGCPDPNGEFDKFGERFDKIDHGGPSGACGETVKKIEGDFFFALAAKIAKKKPIVFSAKITTEDDGMHIVVQSLKESDRTTPTGPPVTLAAYPIGADGTFVAELPELTVPGDANPITTGSPIVAKVTLKGTVCEDLLCGDITGKTSKPIELTLDDGSTFTFTRVEMPGVYPEPPTTNCDGTLADPVGGT